MLRRFKELIGWGLIMSVYLVALFGMLAAYYWLDSGKPPGISRLILYPAYVVAAVVGTMFLFDWIQSLWNKRRSAQHRRPDDVV